MSDTLSRLTAALSGSYRIERELGQGGMATVYLAEDVKHKRKVALKVLKPELAAVLGAERFVQEITTTAALQHPHILPLFDSGTADGFLFYVMPFIDGETLRGKLNRETQLGVDEAVKITVAIADALDHAHRQGVIHRDIKPENILLHEGRPMVADFGIALAVSAAAGGRMTETGLSLGTPHYMSPEQATAEKEISARSDVYSLASVLYEMLAGQPPHLGGSAQQIIMKIVTEVAQPVTAMRKSVPPNVAAAVAKALEKLPADRFESAKAFGEALTNPSFATTAFPATSAGAEVSRRASNRLAVALGGIALAASAFALWGWLRPAPRSPVMRFVLSVPDDHPIQMGTVRDVDISRDAVRFAYIGVGTGGAASAFVRDFESFDALPVAGSANVDELAFSPDGTEMVVRVDGQLRRSGWRGEAPRVIADSAQAGPVWGADNFVYFTERRGNLVRTPAGGGRVELLVEAPAAGLQLWTDILPDGRGGLFVTLSPAVLGEEPTVMVADFANGSTKPLTRGIQATYHSGRIIVLRRDGSVWAARLDLTDLSLEQEPVALAAEMPRGAPSNRSSFALSASGTLIFPWGTDDGTPVRVRRDGRETPSPFSLPFTLGPRLSPDGGRLAVTLVDGTGSDIHVVDLSTGATTRLTFGGASGYPEWTPDGRRVAFYSIDDGVYEMRWRAADASAPAEPLPTGSARPIEIGFLPGGRSFITREGDRSSSENADLVRYDWMGDSLVPTPLTRTPANERSPVISPDGRYVAYVSDAGGRDEVYVRETRPSEGVWTISREGGREPLWARSGTELFYRGGGKLMRVGVQTAPTFAVTEPATTLFPVGTYMENYNHTTYGILPGDGEFVFIKKVSPMNRVVVVMNWMDEVDRLLSPQR